MSTLKKSLVAVALMFSLFAAPAQEAKAAGAFTYHTYVFAIECYTYTYNGYFQKPTGFAYLYAYYS